MAPLTRSQRRGLAAVLCGAMLLRIAWCVFAARFPLGFRDPAFYRHLADQLADGDGYVLEGRPTAYYPIGYPAALAAVFWVVGLVGIDSASARTALTVGLNLAAAAVTLVLVFALARRIAGAWAGIAAAAAVGAMPNLVFHTAVPLSETLFLALFVGAVVVLAGADWRTGAGPGVRRLAAAGALLGLAALVRPVALPVVPLLVVVWLCARLGLRRAVRDVAVVALGAAVVIAPWTVRNAVRMDAFVPISTNTGDNLCMSRQPGADGGFQLTDHCFAGPDIDGLLRPEYETRRDAQGRRLAFEFVREHPGREVGLWLDRLGATFRHDHDGLDAAEGYGAGEQFMSDGERDVYRSVADAAWYLLGPLSLVAAATVLVVPRLRRDPLVVLVVVAAVGVLLPVVLFFGDARFKVPAVPLLAVLVACVPALLRRAASPPSPPAAPALAP